MPVKVWPSCRYKKTDEKSFSENPLLSIILYIWWAKEPRGVGEDVFVAANWAKPKS